MSLSREERERRLYDLLKGRSNSNQAFSFPLSSSQQAIWLTFELEPQSAAYNLPLALRLQGPLNSEALSESLNELLKRHDILRTVCQDAQGTLTQRIRAWQPLDFEQVDLSHLDRDSALADAIEQTQLEARKPFDLRVDLLFRAKLYKLAAEDHVLFLNVHHFVSDGIARRRLLRELPEFYTQVLLEGRQAAKPTASYADFVAWQRQWLATAAAQSQADYWNERLATFPHTLELPADQRFRPDVHSEGARVSVQFSDSLNQDLLRLSRERQVTLFTVLTAGLQVLIQRYTGRDRFLLGTTASVRPDVNYEQLAGTFANNLLLTAEIDEGQTVSELIRQVSSSIVTALEHSYLPFDAVVQNIQPSREPGRNVLFQVSIMLHQDSMAEVMAFPELQASELPLHLGTARLDLAFEFVGSPNGLRLDLEYNTRMFESARIEAIAGHLETLLTAMAADPEQTLTRMPMLRPDEAHRILKVWNQPPDGQAASTTLHGLVEAQVDRTPHLPAVISRDRQWTYQELDEAANRLANQLLALGLERGDVVPILMQPGLERVAAVLGILKAGGAFLPLSTRFPSERIARLLQPIQPKAVLTEREWESLLPAGQRAVTAAAGSAGAFPSQRPSISVSVQDLAYVYYTSGSTGWPKAVMVPHRGTSERMTWGQATYPLGPSDRVLHNSPLIFDASILDIFLPLNAGAALVVPNSETLQDLDELSALMKEQQVSAVWNFVPSLLRSLIEIETFRDLPSLQLLCSGGEALSDDLKDILVHEMPQSLLVNAYGPTEASISTLFWNAKPDQTVRLGRPRTGSSAYVLDELMRPLPWGVPGELFLGGSCVSWGYYNRPAATASAFVPDPFSDAPGARLYRTGDQVRWLSNGELEFIGRSDFQVQIRGIRVELGEIEVTLTRHPDITHALVTYENLAGGHALLSGYIVAQRKVADVDLRDYLLEQLPDYMVPSVFVHLEKLPLTAAGKLDRSVLPSAPRPDPTAALDLPLTPLEKQIAAVWGEVIGLESIDRHADFFMLGGHSLLAFRLVSKLRDKLGFKIPLSALFENPTIAGFASAVQQLD
jgi:amino acid adenylation domain-containing protein